MPPRTLCLCASDTLIMSYVAFIPREIQRYPHSALAGVGFVIVTAGVPRVCASVACTDGQLEVTLWWISPTSDSTRKS